MNRRRLVPIALAPILAAAVLMAVPAGVQGATAITVNGTGAGRVFDGVGGLSGGGGTSRLLYDYPAAEQSQVLDYLFKPGYGASLQILKVEIGSDGNTTNGAEASHERTPTDRDYNRGYEWWLMEQAKARNPNLKLYGLEWGAPGWFNGGVGGAVGFYSQDNINYLIDWIRHAQSDHNLHIDYIGGWNEAGHISPYSQHHAWFVDLKNQMQGKGLTTNGTVKPVPPATAMPDTLLLAATFDRTLAASYGAVVGAEAKTLGNDLIEGPDMNLARVPSGGRTFENLGEDPYLAGQIAASDIQGIQSRGEIGEAKHYLGNEQETNRFSLNSVMDERTMRELYLVPFETSVKQGQAGAVMCAYPRINGTSSCENALIQNTILKGEWGFNGLITSDFGAVHSTVASANNGLDLEMPSGKFFGSALKAAVTSGAVSMATLDDHLVRRFRTTMALGLWDAPPVAHPISATQRAADGLSARQIAEQGIVLLQNTGSLLPLSTSTRRIALIGPMAGAAKTGGGGSSAVVPLYTVSPQAGIQHLDPSATITFDSGATTASAAAAARGADVAIVEVGVNFGEGRDASISLGSQDALVSAVAAANPNTVVVVKSGSVVEMPWASQVKAILEAWYPGEEDGNAVADVLFGAVNPSGRLPITVPGSDQSLVIAPGGATVTYSEGLDMGYRGYEAHNVAPLFPFGFGLSYTTFGYSALTVTPGAGNTATVSFTVANTGTRAGAEVAQVYVGMPAPAGEPPKQLKGFAKVSLAPGASQRVRISLDARAFSVWNTTSHAWTVTSGAYQILVGSSSHDIHLTGSVNE